jgi:REP element-mobilizing transposase RayT
MKRILLRLWARTAGHGRYPDDRDFVAMPNHIHGIVWISAKQTARFRASVGASRPHIRGSRPPEDGLLLSDALGASVDGSPLHPESAPASVHVKHGALRDIVTSFKTTAAIAINKKRGTPGAPVWQRSYHDHIIRNEEDLRRVRQYILDNPRKWAEDPENPLNMRQS